MVTAEPPHTPARLRSCLRHAAALCMLLLLAGCPQQQPPTGAEHPLEAYDPADSVTADLDVLCQRGTLRALLRFSASSYFLYRGEPMGFEYELLESLAQELGLELEIVVPDRWSEMLPMLYRGAGDVIAAPLAVTRRRAEKVAFVNHMRTNRQVLVQRLPQHWRRMTRDAIDDQLIRNQIDLIGKPVHVRWGSAYETRLRNLSEEIGGEISIVSLRGDFETEDLIGKVAEGVYDYTVADENLARTLRLHYPNIDIRTPISFPQRIAWAVRPNAPQLQAAINRWLEKIQSKKDPLYYNLYNKYYKNRLFVRKFLSSSFLTHTTGRISPYDQLIKQAAGRIGWDWKLLAAQIYRESRFNADEVSWAGAQGLMQIMPRVANEYQVSDPLDPAENIRAGTALLAWLDQYWGAISDPQEKIKFVLASYNVGQGHVQDARRLAAKYGADPDRWDDEVAPWLQNKSRKKYYTDPVVRHGYCRGIEPCTYVADVLAIYAHYQRFIPADNATMVAEGQDGVPADGSAPATTP